MKNKLVAAIVVALVTFAFVGCSKDDDNPTSDKGVLKVTVTAEGYTGEGGSTMSAQVIGSSAQGPTLWKVNGAAGTSGQSIYDLNKEYFAGGKTATFESTSSYLAASVTISAAAFTQPFKLVYKIEQGGRVIVEQTKDILPDTTPTVLSFQY
ncbi:MULTISPECIES: beta-barrel fold lipoprotein [Sphingobacterium]|uniref:Beta-barrel fold lipoprotein n=1 Tax=Sphingobacterium populi TaxID=1812824 RepID=A0ABW5U7N2_9SPHI|nr:beta-barrel fold lipoprotein [Sphingobacterium sp. CFCC 11742]